MDFNKSFEAYDSLDGGRCLTVPGIKTQKAAAIEAEKELKGLHLIKAIPEDLFIKYNMQKELGTFKERYNLLLKA